MIVIPRDGSDELIERAIRNDPREICGILGGDYGEKRSIVRTIVHTENVAPNARREYEIDPEELLACLERIEADGNEIVGFYHSHPRGPATPSMTDIDRATWVDYSYVIVDISDDAAVRSWRWRGPADGFDPERVTISQGG